MALQLKNGETYNCDMVRTGESKNGSWVLARIKDKRGRNKVTLFVTNDDAGLKEVAPFGTSDNNWGEGFDLRVDDFGLNGEGAKDGATWGMEEFPKNSGKFQPKLTFGGVTAHKVGQIHDVSGQFEVGEMKETEFGGDLPF